MRIESSTLLAYKENGGKPILLPEGTHKIRVIIEHEKITGTKCYIRCYNEKGDKLDTIRFFAEQ